MITQGEPKKLSVQGAPFRCTACRHERFWRRRVRLDLWNAEEGIDFANVAVSAFVCERCGYVHQFMDPKS